MRIVIRGLVLFVLLAIAVIVGLLSFTASLSPQPQIERVIIPVTEGQYQAPEGNREKVFSATVNEQTQSVTDNAVSDTQTEVSATNVNTDTETGMDITAETTQAENDTATTMAETPSNDRAQPDDAADDTAIE